MMIVKRCLMIFIKCYQYCLSPLTGAQCRYNPTCSHYMHQAIEKYGVFKGLFLGLKRLCSCHPWSKKDMQDPLL